MLHMCACVCEYVRACVCQCVCLRLSVSFNDIGTTTLQFYVTKKTTNNYNMAVIELSVSLYCSRPRICNARSAFMFIYFNILVFTDCLYFDNALLADILFFQILLLLFIYIYMNWVVDTSDI